MPRVEGGKGVCLQFLSKCWYDTDNRHDMKISTFTIENVHQMNNTRNPNAVKNAPRG